MSIWIRFAPYVNIAPLDSAVSHELHGRTVSFIASAPFIALYNGTQVGSFQVEVAPTADLHLERFSFLVQDYR